MSQHDPLAGKKQFLTVRKGGGIVFADFNDIALTLPIVNEQSVEFAKDVLYDTNEQGPGLIQRRTAIITGDQLIFTNGDKCPVNSLDENQEGWLMPLKT